MTAITVNQLFLAHGYSNPYSQLITFLPDLDFLNLDLQGVELRALRGMEGRLHNFKWIYTEVNKEKLYKGCALVEDIDNFLIGWNFKRVETQWCGNTGWGDALYIHRSVMP
jgi:hypothetical protein